MAYARNTIGEFKFSSLEGDLDVPGQMVAVDSRPGVDGSEFTLLGRKGQPFMLISTVDVDDLAAADATVAEYKDTLLGSGGVQIWKNDAESPGGCLFKVLNVTKLASFRISTAVGNKISNNAGALLICRWELMAVPA